MRRAYESARETGTTTPELDTAFQRAAKVSRDVRGATALGQAGRSLVQFALQLAGTRLTDWRRTRALIVGTGNYAATTVAACAIWACRSLPCTRSRVAREQFAERYGVLRRTRAAGAVADAEVVITCTNTYSVTVADIPDLRAGRSSTSGLPRNVDPAVGRLPGVELMDLELIATHARLPMLAPDATARELVSSAAEAFAAEQAAAPAIVALRRHVFDALDSELARLGSKSVPPEQAAAVAEALRHFAGALLHGPTQRARDLAGRRKGRAVRGGSRRGLRHRRRTPGRFDHARSAARSTDPAGGRDRARLTRISSAASPASTWLIAQPSLRRHDDVRVVVLIRDGLLLGIALSSKKGREVSSCGR